MTWEALEPLLEATGYPYFRQGSLAPDESYPEAFFTFWDMDTPESAYYDNSPHCADWSWRVYFYTADPALLYTVMDALAVSAREAGFTVQGRARDLPSDEPGVSGRTILLAYKQNYSEESE